MSSDRQVASKQWVSDAHVSVKESLIGIVNSHRLSSRRGKDVESSVDFILLADTVGII